MGLVSDVSGRSVLDLLPKRITTDVVMETDGWTT